MTARSDAAAGRPPPLNLAKRLRFTARVTMMLVATLIAVPLHFAWLPFVRKSPWPRRYLGWLARISGARIQVVGTPRRRDVFYISNHVSWIDILSIAGASGSAFVAKIEIRESPVVGWMSTLNDTVFVTREDKLGVGAQIDRLRESLGDAWAVTVFPEGTTTDGHSLLPFKSSMLKVLEPPPPRVLVQPILLDYGVIGEEISWIGAETGANNAVRVLARAGAFPLTVHFLEPFSPAEVTGRKAIAAEARRRIEAAMAATARGPFRPFVDPTPAD